jgi:hypothetical protein
MRTVSYIVAAAALAGTLAGCADPYYPRYGYSQGYYQPSQAYYQPSQAYYQPSGYSYYPSGYNYPSGYAYDSRSDYYRNYNGIHPPAERTYP